MYEEPADLAAAIDLNATLEDLEPDSEPIVNIINFLCHVCCTGS